MSEANVINEYCQGAVQAGSMYDTFDSYADMTAVLDQLAQFKKDDMLDAFDESNITILSTSTFDSGVARVRFSVNGKEGVTYCWARNYGKTADGPTLQSYFGQSGGKAVLVIPGSGTNEVATMINGTNSYEAIFYSIGCATGDTFGYCYPGEDLRCMVGTNSPTALKLIRSQIENYLLIHGTSTAIVVMVELCAIMKFLRTAHSIDTNWPSYTKIGVMGLSKGAFPALLTGIYTTPTACVSASGFSLREYRSLGLGAVGGNVIPGMEDILSHTDIIAAITGSATKFYYTHSTSGNELALIKEEADDETATALAGSNFTDNKHTEGHVYPSGTASWLQTALA